MTPSVRPRQRTPKQTTAATTLSASSLTWDVTRQPRDTCCDQGAGAAKLPHLDFCLHTLPREMSSVPDNNSNNDRNAKQEPSSEQINAIPNSNPFEDRSVWSIHLWDNGWNGEAGMFGAANLCVATKKWANGTVDVLIAHALGFEDSMPTAYAHRHGDGVTPLTVHGPAKDVVRTVIDTWGPPETRSQTLRKP
jgi:hypothetical protein